MFIFGERIKTLRKNRGLTQKQVAEGLKMTERNYQRYEADKIKPTYDGLNALADFFNVSVDYLMGRTD